MVQCTGRKDILGDTIECNEILDSEYVEVNGNQCIDCMHSDYMDELIG